MRTGQACFKQSGESGDAAGSDLLMSEPNVTTKEADAPEIEITPAMIEAGVEAFCAFDRFYDTRAEIVAGVFRAMEAARSSPGDLEKSPKAGR
jgi:hypothetical protein